MQKQFITLTGILVAATLSCGIGKAFAQESSAGFEQTLRDSGWSVQREPDGSLIVNRANSEKQNIEENISSPDHMTQMQNELQAAGWNIHRESDGTLVLYPPTASATEIEKDKHPLADMQQKLRKTGWIVTKTSDGSMLLYPPGKSASAQQTQPQAAPGFPPSLQLELPVDSWQEAKDISLSWLDNQPPYNTAIGKIRKIFRVYLVSIVSDVPPYNLIQQIAIRTSDGAVIVLN